MELKFLGVGAAFNPSLGSNSAYFIDNNELFLLDCGESVFKEIIEHKLLDKVKKVNVMITHTHSDHIGSLGSLILYVFHVKESLVNIIVKKSAKYIDVINNILVGNGCSKDRYKYVLETDFDGKYKTFNKIRFKETIHSDDMDCYSIIFETNNGILYYSGDTKELNTIKNIIDSGEEIDKLFIDVSSDKNKAHVYIEDLKKGISKEFRSKVYCMHFNNDECIKKALNYGFNVAKKIG